MLRVDLRNSICVFRGSIMKRIWVVPAIVAALLLLAASGARAADAASIGSTVYLAGVHGTDPDPLRQVDEVVQKAHERLGGEGLGIGNMVQHTIFIKDGAIDPINVLQRFHAAATRLAPSLKERRSVGTIIRVPDFPDRGTVIMLDIVAGVPKATGAADDFARIPFTFGPAEIVETVRVGDVVYTAGLEAMDFQHGTLAPGIDAQLEAIVAKLDGALKKAGLTIGDMVSHNLYVKKGTDPMHVIEKFHELTRRYAPELKARPSVGNLVLVDGMAADGFLLEMDAIAVAPRAHGKPTRLRRVLFDDRTMPIARSVTAGEFVFLSGADGSDPAKNGAVPDDVAGQIEVAVRKIDAALRRAGSSIGDLVKVRLYLKNGAADPEQVRGRFREAAARLAPRLTAHPVAETLLLVEGLAADKASFEASVIATRGRK